MSVLQRFENLDQLESDIKTAFLEEVAPLAPHQSQRELWSIRTRNDSARSLDDIRVEPTAEALVRGNHH